MDLNSRMSSSVAAFVCHFKCFWDLYLFFRLSVLFSCSFVLLLKVQATYKYYSFHYVQSNTALPVGSPSHFNFLCNRHLFLHPSDRFSYFFIFLLKLHAMCTILSIVQSNNSYESVGSHCMRKGFSIKSVCFRKIYSVN